jgi:penicillin amidase
MFGVPSEAFAPWTAADVLAVGRLQAFNLGYQADEEIAQSDFALAARMKMTGPRAGFLVDAVRFAPIESVTPLAGFPNDVQGTMSKRDEHAATATANANAKPKPVADAKERHDALVAARAFAHAVESARKVLGDKALGFTGSNNWVIAPSRSATGHAMLASDPHLSLSAPSVFWMVHVSVDSPKVEEQVDFAGLSFPGLPGIILGFNANVAWGATTADYDVTDVYDETLAEGGSGVVFRGATVPFQRVRETIAIRGGAPLEYDVLVVPHHGPIVPTITAQHTVAPPSGTKALSVKWTGHQPTKDLAAVFGLLRAKNVDDARVALKDFAVGAQNWVVADTSGNIFYTSQSLIPKRDKAAFKWDPATGVGNIPCLVLPGDVSSEWTGAYLEDAFIPHVKNPAKGYVATANTEQVGTTLDNDPTNDKLPNGEPMYMACWHDPGFRLARITQRIEGAGHPLTLDDLASIQGDARSAMGSKLAPQILTALEHADLELKTPGSNKGLEAVVASERYKSAPIAELKDLLQRWAAEADYDAASGLGADDNSPSTDAKEAMASRATTVFNAWLVAMYHATFDDELATIGSPFAFDARRMLLDVMSADAKTLKTFDAASSDSILFDDSRTTPIETRDERIVTSLLDAIDFLRARLGADTQQWRWGRLHTIRFKSLVSIWKTFSIPPDPDATFPLGFPRHGDGYNVDVAGYALPPKLDDKADFTYAHGPTQRLVIDMDPKGPVARNALPGGNVWNPQDPHFRDEAERWRRNQNRPVPFAAADVIAAAESRVIFEHP